MRALVLSGGARKGAYQAGAILELMKFQQREYDVFVGISVGAINAAFLAQFQDPMAAGEQLYELWEEVDNSQVRKLWYGGMLSILPALWKGSVFDTQPLRDTVTYYLDPELIRHSGKKLKVGAVSLDSGHYKVFTEKFPHIHDAVLASSAFPGFLQDVEINGEMYTDGGVRNVVPIRDALAEGVTEIDVIVTGPTGKMERWEYSSNAILKGRRVVDIMSHEIFLTDFLQYASTIPSGPTIRLLAPTYEFGGDPLDFDDRQLLDEMMQQGLRDAKDRWVTL